MNQERCRVMIADDHPIVRAGLARVIELQPGFQVIAQASNGKDAQAHLLTHKPDIAVLDISMPEADGFDVMAWAQEQDIPTKFLLLTQHMEDEYVEKAKRLGALGYVRKESALAELMEAINAVLAGQFYLSRGQATHDQQHNSHQEELTDVLADHFSRLTPTERLVLRYLAQNLTSKEIAELMQVSYRTVQNHRANICSKLNMRGNNRLLQFALEYRDQISALE